MKKLSIIIPIYNEKDTLLEIIKRVEKVPVFKLEKELILVDDGSTDSSRDILKKLEGKYTVVYHEKNQGKGRAVRTGIGKATGDLILIQDADLELNPDNYPALLKPVLENNADIVYGSRYKQRDDSIYKSHYWGVRVLSILTNLLYGSDLTDVYCGYKVFKADVLKNFDLTSDSFEIESEMTVKALKKGYKINEVPIDYFPRKFNEGKKIRLTNGLKAILVIMKHKFYS